MSDIESHTCILAGNQGKSFAFARSANENFETVTYATEGFSGRSKAETSASRTN